MGSGYDNGNVTTEPWQWPDARRHGDRFADGVSGTCPVCLQPFVDGEVIVDPDGGGWVHEYCDGA